MSGDATISNAGVLTLASTISAAGPVGSATVTPIITYDAKGRLTTVTSATVTPSVNSITGLGTEVATALAVNTQASGSFAVLGNAVGTAGRLFLDQGVGVPAQFAVMSGGATISNSGVVTLVGGLSGFATCSGSVGLSAVAGAATTTTRSDGSCALSQAIAPTWTGRHIWAVTPTYDQASNALGTGILFQLDSATQTVAAGKSWSGIRFSRSDGTNISWTIGAASQAANIYSDITSALGSSATSSAYGGVLHVTNAGPGTVKGAHTEGTALTGSTGTTTALNTQLTLVATSPVGSSNIQVGLTSGGVANDIATGIFFFANSSDRYQYGVGTLVAPISYNIAFMQAWMATGSGSSARFVQLLNNSGTEIFYVSKDGVTAGADGAVGGPGHSFWAETNTGMYRIGTGNLGFSVSGIKIVDVATTGVGITGAIVGTSSSATAFAIGRQGTTTPAFQVDASAATSVTGLKLTAAAAGGGVTLIATSTATDENLTIRAKGAGTLTLDATGAGFVLLGDTTTISAATTINLNGSSLPAGTPGTLLQLGQANGTATTALLDAFGVNNSLLFRRANGTNASKTAVQSGETIGQIAARGYGATDYSSGARAAIDLVAAQNWTDSAQGTYVAVRTTPTGSTTPANVVVIGADGGVNIGSSTTAVGAGNLVVAGTIASNGSILMGSGIASGLYGDGTSVAVRTFASTAQLFFQNASGASTFGVMNSTGWTVGSGATPSVAALAVVYTTTSSSTSTGALVVGNGSAGGLGVGGAAFFGGTVSFTNGGAAQAAQIIYDAGNTRFNIDGNGSTFGLTFRATNGSGELWFATGGTTVTTKMLSTGAWTFGAAITMSALTTAAGTPNSICQNNATKEITVNAALTCTVSSLRFKHDFAELDGPALSIVMSMRPGSFYYNDNDRHRIGFASEYMAALDERLADGFDEDRKPRSIDQNAILAVTVKALQELKSANDNLQAANDNLEARLRRLEAATR